MSKILKFKENVTIGDAAKYLTKMLGEEVTESDVEELIIDGHIRASIVATEFAAYFVKEETISTGTAAGVKIHKWSYQLGDQPDDWLRG